MKRVPPTQESLRFPNPERGPRSLAQAAKGKLAGVVDLSAARKRANEATKATLVTDVCARATHLADIFVPRNK